MRKIVVSSALREEDLLPVETAYGRSKQKGERMVRLLQVLTRFYALGWASREPGTRLGNFTPRGLEAFREIFGVAAEA